MTLTAKGLAPLTRIDYFSNDYLTPQRYAPAGATLADGTSQPLSDFYASLALAQVDFPFVTATTQQTDWACLQKMTYEAIGYPTFEHADVNAHLNKMMYVPAGKYQVGTDKWIVINASGITIRGAGRRSTLIQGSSIVFAADGLWFSSIESIGFESTGAAAAVVDIDGNVPGHAYATRGVQGNTFKDFWVYGANLATYGFALTRQGNPPGPGAQGSENSYINCHFHNCVTANWFSTGFNALQNTFIGCNFQGHQKHGLHAVFGSIYLFSCGFQSTYAYAQITNDGYDINSDSGGVSERVTVIGCRTESLRFFRGSGSQPPVLIGNNQTYGGGTVWVAATAYTLNQTVTKTSPTLGPKLYRVTTAGTSGGAEPTWPDTGTVSDNTVVWTMTDFYVVDVSTGSGTFIDNGWTVGSVRSGLLNDFPLGMGHAREIAASYTATLNDEFLLCTPTSNIVISLPMAAPVGKRFYVKKENTNASTVSVVGDDSSAPDGVAGSGLIPGGSRGWIVVELAGGGAVTKRYWIIAQDTEIVATSANTANKIVKRNANGVFSISGLEIESWNASEWIKGATTEQITLNTGGTTTDSTADLLPANSIIEAVVSVIDVTVTTATTVQVGDPTTATRFGSFPAMGAGNKSVGLNHRKGSVTTDAAGATQTAAAKIRITTDVNPGAGKVRVVVFYSQFVAPGA